MGVALVTKRVVSSLARLRRKLVEKEQGNAVLAFLYVVNNRLLSSCTLLIRRSVSGLKVGVTVGFEAYKIRLACSVTVGISCKKLYHKSTEV